MLESGWSPINHTLNDKGELASTAQSASPIQRSTKYTYQIINNRSVLTEVDGPLPNGKTNTPADSDITRYQWDARGSFITQVIAPGGYQTTYSRDEAGRIIKTSYDNADRLLSIADARDHRAQLQFDAEGHILMAGLYLPGQGSVYRASYYQHDSLGRLTHRLLPDGRFDAYTYDNQGQLSEHQQSHGQGADILHSYRSNASKTAQAHIQQGADGWLRVNLRTQTRAGQAKASDLADDFGRIVYQILPDHGNKTAHYDAGGRIQQIHSADGSVHSYQYDNAGRLLQRSYQAQPQAPATIQAQMAYRGQLLTSISNPAQTSHYQYDALGRKTSEDIHLSALANQASQANQVNPTSIDQGGATARQLGLRTATRYDSASGLIHSRILADGHILRTQRSSAQEGASAQSLSLQSPWAAWLQDKVEELLPQTLASILIKALPRQMIAQNISIHPFNGLTGYAAGNGLTTAKTHDTAGRMTQLRTDKVSTVQYSYGIGARIQEIKQQTSPSNTSNTSNTNNTNSSAKLLNASYQYASFGGLIEPSEIPLQHTETLTRQSPSAPSAQSAPPTPATPSIIAIKKEARSAINTPATPSKASRNSISNPDPLDPLGRTRQDAKHRYSYTPSGQIQAVADIASGTLVAQYAYNSQNQRVRKSEHTSYYLWQANRLAAELDDQGRITSQYIYLNEGQQATPIAKLESPYNPDNPSKSDRLLFIHTDHRATPIAMTDADQAIVWQAAWTPRGMIKAGLNTNAPQKAQSAVLNIRLPGQYYDAETGLHDNLHRTYNPQTGRYLQPDPLGYPDGPDAYLYAGGDPINKTDPLGLYSTEVHYYMTYFLARMAGIETQEALTIALAAQYIDDNPDTWPLDERAPLSNFANPFAYNRLARYHFTQSGYDPRPNSNEIITTPGQWIVGPLGLEYVPATTTYTQSYINRRFINPSNPQLGNLRFAVSIAPTRCAKAQFMGEFLHAFQDTFAHRNQTNESIDINGNAGHLLYGREPDKTYNEVVTTAESSLFILSTGNWNQRESRTFQMEKETYSQLRSYASSGSNSTRTIAFSEIEGFLQQWNRTRDSTDKIFMLDEKLQQLGFGPLPVYDQTCAAAKRKEYIGGLVQRNYSGTILPAGQGSPGSARAACNG
jgi:RHS repeat-associated protein